MLLKLFMLNSLFFMSNVMSTPIHDNACLQISNFDSPMVRNCTDELKLSNDEHADQQRVKRGQLYPEPNEEMKEILRKAVKETFQPIDETRRTLSQTMSNLNRDAMAHRPQFTTRAPRFGWLNFNWG